MENTANEFVKLFRDRLKYPIVTLYTIVLIIYNWDVLSVFFLSNTDIEDRIDYINKEFAGQTWWRLLCPLIKALVVSVLAPLLMWLLDWALHKVNTERTKLRDKKALNLSEIKEQLALTDWRIQQAKNGNQSELEQQKKVNDLTESLKKQQENYEAQIEIINKTLVDQKTTYEGIITELNNQLEILNKRVDFYVNISGDNLKKSDKFINSLVKDSDVDERLVKYILISIPSNEETFVSMIKRELEISDIPYNNDEIQLILKYLELSKLIEVNSKGEINLTGRGRIVRNSLMNNQ